MRFLVASSSSFGPSLSTPQHFPDDYADYLQLFEQSRELVRKPERAAIEQDTPLGSADPAEQPAAVQETARPRVG